MARKPNHQADIKNGNWGTPGTNKTWDKAQGNRGKQLQEARPKPPAGQGGKSQGKPGPKK